MSYHTRHHFSERLNTPDISEDREAWVFVEMFCDKPFGCDWCQSLLRVYFNGTESCYASQEVPVPRQKETDVWTALDEDGYKGSPRGVSMKNLKYGPIL